MDLRNALYLPNLLTNFLYKIISQFWYSHFFMKFGKNSKIVQPLCLKNTQYILISDDVTINRKVFLMTEIGHFKSPKLEIGKGSIIGNFNHIVCYDELLIGQYVLTADKVYISDNCHDYKDIGQPVSHQAITTKGKTTIGDNSWIGENVCIISSNIGKHCIIGANSVVTSDIPDYCVAVGVPAKVIKRYDFEKQVWIRC